MAQATTYAVHTEACTYLLDEDGICCRILAPGGLITEAMSAAIGSQFVACLDMSLPGGLVAELRVGASALFACKDEQGRFVLMRTSSIRSVEIKEMLQPLALPPLRANPILPASPPRRPSKPPRTQRASKPAPQRPARPAPPQMVRGDSVSLSEHTLSLARPLFRPQPPAPTPPSAPPPPPRPPERPRAPPVPPPRTIAKNLPPPTPDLPQPPSGTPVAPLKGPPRPPPPRPREPAAPPRASAPPPLPRDQKLPPVPRPPQPPAIPPPPKPKRAPDSIRKGKR